MASIPLVLLTVANKFSPYIPSNRWFSRFWCWIWRQCLHRLRSFAFGQVLRVSLGWCRDNDSLLPAHCSGVMRTQRRCRQTAEYVITKRDAAATRNLDRLFSSRHAAPSTARRSFRNVVLLWGARYGGDGQLLHVRWQRRWLVRAGDSTPMRWL